jgi:Mlc titration factor MtfA (ptsG expression regulator)
MLKYLFIFGFLLLVFLFIRRLWKRNSWVFPDTDFPVKWRKILAEKISFYNALKQEEKKDFEYKIQEFLLNCKITGIKTEVDLTDKILVAASAIIPIFPFKDWRYLNLQEVLLYPGRFTQDFAVEGDKRNILGMVGNGSMEGKMILSKLSLHKGFSIATDKKNTAIHEFVHLIDKMDGSTDGIPELLVDKQFSIPWMKLIQEKTQEILDNQSDINPYASTSPTEFLAVVSEYFFERPKLLAEKHPKLYAILEQIFKQKMKKRKLHFKKFKTGRNSPCPCGSGMKFKHCCGKKD